jgi:hypothetical protein
MTLAYVLRSLRHCDDIVSKYKQITLRSERVVGVARTDDALHVAFHSPKGAFKPYL